MKKKLLLMLLVTAALSASAGAASIVIEKAGFENPALDAGDWTIVPPPGWGWIGDPDITGAWNIPGILYGGGAPEGDNIGYVWPVDNGDGTWGEGGLGQILTDTLTVDTAYTLTVGVGNCDYYEWAGYKVQFLAGGTGTSPGEITGGTLLAEDDNSLTPDDNSFETSTVTYTYDPADAALLGQPLQIRLIAKPGLDNEIDFDNVKLNAAGPSPVGVTVAPGDVYLNWVNEDPILPATVVYVDVYFGTVSGSLTQVVTADDGTGAGLDLTTLLVSAPDEGTYYWRIDSYLDGTTGDAPDVVGAEYTFDTGPPASPAYPELLVNKGFEYDVLSIPFADPCTAPTGWYFWDGEWVNPTIDISAIGGGAGGDVGIDLDCTNEGGYGYAADYLTQDIHAPDIGVYTLSITYVLTSSAIINPSGPDPISDDVAWFHVGMHDDEGLGTANNYQYEYILEASVDTWTTMTIEMTSSAPSDNVTIQAQSYAPGNVIIGAVSLIAPPKAPTLIAPADGEVFVLTAPAMTEDVDLSWTNINPIDPCTPVYLDLFFKAPGDADFTKLIDATVDVNDIDEFSLTALPAGVYLWRVDSYSGSPTGTMFEGPVWSFTVCGDPPTSVDAGNDIYTWLNEPVTLAPTVVGGTTLIYEWSIVAHGAIDLDDITFDPSPYVENPQVSVSAIQYDQYFVRELVLELKVNGVTAPETVSVWVALNGCEAAKKAKLDNDSDFGDIRPGYSGSWDNDCITNLGDFSLLSRWYGIELELSEPVALPLTPGTVSLIPDLGSTYDPNTSSALLQVLGTLNDNFAYVPDSWTPLPDDMDYHATLSIVNSASRSTHAYDFDGVYNNISVDVFGRRRAGTEGTDDDFRIEFIRDGVIVEEIDTGIKSTSEEHVNETADPGTQADRIKIVNLQNGYDNTNMNLIELRVNGTRVAPLTPTVDLGDNMKTWDEKPVTIVPTVTGTDLTYAWSIRPAWDLSTGTASNDWDPNLTFVMSDPCDAPTQTITVDKDILGGSNSEAFVKFEVKLTVSDGVNSATDIMTIDVYDDGLTANTKDKLDGRTYISGDVNQDDVADFDDIGAMAMEWLDDTTLLEPYVKP